MVRTFADAGHGVSVIGRRPAAERDQEIGGTEYWTVDVVDEGAVSAALTEILDRPGTLSHLVFLQRYRGQGEGWPGEIETTLTATKWMIERLAPEFNGAGSKAIVLVSSVMGSFIAGGQPLSYRVGKAGLNQMVRYFAVALGPRGVRVNSVSPFTILKEESRDFYLENNRLQALYRAITPLGRMGTAEDVARVIAFLCGPDASFITGQNIVVDGGLSLVWQESLARQVAGV